MVFLCPGEIDLASAHGLVRAFHAERADIDMRQNDGDHRHAGRSVEVLRDLHPVDIRERERKEEQDARYGKRRSPDDDRPRSEEHTSELQSLMRISYTDFCLKKTQQPKKAM